MDWTGFGQQKCPTLKYPVSEITCVRVGEAGVNGAVWNVANPLVVLADNVLVNNRLVGARHDATVAIATESDAGR